MNGAFLFVVALVSFTLLSTTDASTTTLIPEGRIKFGPGCRQFLTYDNTNRLFFGGPSPTMQHWYRAYDSSRPGKFMLVSHPVPVKALKVVCSSFGCYLYLVSISQLYNGWTFPTGLGGEYFFTKDVKGSMFALRSVFKPTHAITAMGDGLVGVSYYTCSPNQLFCAPKVHNVTTTLPSNGSCSGVSLGLTRQEVVGRIKKAPDCSKFLGYDDDACDHEISLQGPSPVRQHWSFFSGSTSTDGSFMIATYPAPNKVLKVECITRGIILKGKTVSTTMCFLKLVNAPCSLMYDTPFYHPGDAYLFTRVKYADGTFAIKSVLRPELAITVNADNSIDILTQLIPTTEQLFCESNCTYRNKAGRLIFSTDLTAGSASIPSYTRTGVRVSWQSALSGHTAPCRKEGLIKLTFPNPVGGKQRYYLVFDLYLQNNPGRFAFNIGDSTNNGYGGDAGTTSNAAEVHNVFKHWYVYSNNLSGYQSYAGSSTLLVERLLDVMTNHITLTIGDEYVEFDNNQGVQKCYSSKYLFTLSGQTPRYGVVNYDIFFAMNRVIRFVGNRIGPGLCRATIREVEV